MEIATALIYAAISIAAAVYAASVYSWMRGRVRAALPYGNGRLALAQGARAAALRKLAVALLNAAIGLLVAIRDAYEMMTGPEPTTLPALITRLMFIAMILLILDSIRITKTVYVRTERHR